MASQSSFDIVSKFDHQELRNAVDQALREIHTRFDCACCDEAGRAYAPSRADPSEDVPGPTIFCDSRKFLHLSILF